MTIWAVIATALFFGFLMFSFYLMDQLEEERFKHDNTKSRLEHKTKLYKGEVEFSDHVVKLFVQANTELKKLKAERSRPSFSETAEQLLAETREKKSRM